jgi:hypothetical protein
MTVPKRKLFTLIVLAAVCLLYRVPSARASAIQLTDVSELSAGGTKVSYPSAPPNSFDVDAVGITLSFSTQVAFNEFDQDGSFAPEFPFDSTILFNLMEGPLTISFLPGISEVGFFAQGFVPDTPQGFAVNVFNGLSLLRSFTVGPDPNVGFPGKALFIGARASNGDLITQLTITNTELSDDPSFVIGPLTFSERSTAQPVPEPASLVLLGSGLVGAGVRMRKRFTRA